MKTAAAFGVLLAVVAGRLGAQGTKQSAGEALVAQLYADFACEAVVESGCDARHTLADQPKIALAKYFDERLVGLWLADRACAARTHEICKLDFSPIWDSQDPAGTSVKVVGTRDAAIVNVELHSGSSSERRVLRYTLAKTPAGWRIHDIARGTEWSLVTLLAGKS